MDALVLQIRLMVREASTRFADAGVLDSTVRAPSDSAYLLQLLAFEILLKAVVRVNDATPQRNHSYSELIQLLPATVQAQLIQAATDRMAMAADYSNPDVLFTTWAKNFVRLRYPYERYEGLTQAEYQARGEAWVRAGAEVSQADFVYFSSELHGFTYALQGYLDAWLARRDS